MRVVRTATKNSPSKAGSRASRARLQVVQSRSLGSGPFTRYGDPGMLQNLHNYPPPTSRIRTTGWEVKGQSMLPAPRD